MQNHGGNTSRHAPVPFAASKIVFTAARVFPRDGGNLNGDASNIIVGTDAFDAAPDGDGPPVSRMRLKIENENRACQRMRHDKLCAAQINAKIVRSWLGHWPSGLASVSPLTANTPAASAFRRR